MYVHFPSTWISNCNGFAVRCKTHKRLPPVEGNSAKFLPAGQIEENACRQDFAVWADGMFRRNRNWRTDLREFFASNSIPCLKVLMPFHQQRAQRYYSLSVRRESKAYQRATVVRMRRDVF